ncbi:hypothetical protein AAEX28_13200 [Lentisphaerota bacterium WC36G]|nr:hypothetical protein LJT99_16030 [Lentisphaerae bacterium WC36]
MEAKKFWQNYNLGKEIEIAGEFIVDGINIFNRIEYFSDEVKVFKFLYEVSVGIERLAKVALILLDDSLLQEKIEKAGDTDSSKHHNHIKLIQDIEKHQKLNLCQKHRALLHIFEKFYNNQRYRRLEYHIKELGYTAKEIKELENFFINNFNHKKEFLTFDKEQLKNNDTIKRQIYTVVSEITKELYRAVSEQARKKSIYTYEVPYNSKAGDLFLRSTYSSSDKNELKTNAELDELTKKEVIVALINHEKSKFGESEECDDEIEDDYPQPFDIIEIIKSIKPIQFDESMVGLIMALFDHHKLIDLKSMVETEYDELSNTQRKERAELLSCINNSCFDY